MNYTVVAYTRKGGNELQDAMHLAAVREDGSLLPLHNGTGILFAKAEFFEGPLCGTTKVLRLPWIFRLKDNSFGIVCLRRNTGGKPEPGREHCVLLFTSPDLLSFQEAGLIPVAPQGIQISDIRCRWNSTDQLYELVWRDGNTWYCTESPDLSNMKNSYPTEAPVPRHTVDLPDAEAGCSVSLSKQEYESILHRYLPVTQTGCVPVRCRVPTGTVPPLPETVLLTYSDGSTKLMPAQWEPFSETEPGQYTVHGTIRRPDWSFPFLSERADPMMIRFRDQYYFMATDDENGQTTLKIRGSSTIDGLKHAEEHSIFTANPEGAMSGCLWAPELHVVNDRLYVFFAAGSPHWYTVQCHVMALTGENPLDAACWAAPVRCRTLEGSVLCPDGITLDMTCFTVGNTPYVVWAQRTMHLKEQEFGNSDLYIASVDPEAPWQLTSQPVCICRPSYGWDRIDTTVDEGPFILRHGDDLFLTFSGSSVSVLYCVGLLHAKIGSNLLEPSSWVETGYPILTSESVDGELGPGHNAYTKDAFGNDILVYHAKLPAREGLDPGMSNRHTGLRPVHWDADGLPRLDMTPEREVSPSFQLTASVELTARKETAAHISSNRGGKAARWEKAIFMNMCMVYDHKGNVLVQDKISQSWGGVTFPGGHVEEGESFSDSVIREIREETGLLIQHPQLCGVKQWYSENGSIRCVVLCYKTDHFQGDPTASAEGAVRWVPVNSLLEMKLASGMDAMLQLFLEDTFSEHYLHQEGEQWIQELK